MEINEWFSEVSCSCNLLFSQINTSVEAKYKGKSIISIMLLHGGARISYYINSEKNVNTLLHQFVIFCNLFH